MLYVVLASGTCLMSGGITVVCLTGSGAVLDLRQASTLLRGRHLTAGCWVRASTAEKGSDTEACTGSAHVCWP